MWSTFCFTTAWKFCQPSRIADKEFDPRDTFWLFCPKVTVHLWYPSLYLWGSPKVTMTGNCDATLRSMCATHSWWGVDCSLSSSSSSMPPESRKVTNESTADNKRYFVPRILYSSMDVCCYPITLKICQHNTYIFTVRNFLKSRSKPTYQHFNFSFSGCCLVAA